MSPQQTRRANQHLPAGTHILAHGRNGLTYKPAWSVPDEILRPLVEEYYSYGWGDRKIVEHIELNLDLPANNWAIT
jgi:hypothetical protein